MRTSSDGSEEYRIEDVLVTWNTAFAALLDLLYCFHLYKPDMRAWDSFGIQKLDSALVHYYSALPKQHAHPDHESGNRPSVESCWFCREAKRGYIETLEQSMKGEVDRLYSVSKPIYPLGRQIDRTAI